MPVRNIFRYVQASVPGLWEAKSGLLNLVM
jgi:hypothetical protein